MKFKTTGRHDPYKDFNFKVTFTGKRAVYDTGWNSVTGLNAIIDYLEHQEGGNPGAAYQIPDIIRFEPITLRRGMSEDKSIVTAFAGQMNNTVGVHNRDKYTVKIQLLDSRTRAVVKTTTLYEAWISALATSEYNAQGGGVFMEQATLSFRNAAID